jgi:carbon-monoxide dehydrogenase medium subunit
VGAGAWVALDDNGRVRAARLGLGAVAPTPLLAEEAAAALIGTTLDEAALARMEAAVQSLCRPIDDKRGTAAYRRRVVAVLARRAVLAACQRARG